MFGRETLTFSKDIVEDVSENIAGAFVVRVRKGTAGDCLEAQMVPPALKTAEAGAGVPEARNALGLDEKHDDELLPAIEFFGVPVTLVLVDAFLEIVSRKKL
jgi:hypothetical protein